MALFFQFYFSPFAIIIVVTVARVDGNKGSEFDSRRDLIVLSSI